MDGAKRHPKAVRPGVEGIAPAARIALMQTADGENDGTGRKRPDAVTEIAPFDADGQYARSRDLAA